MKRELKPRRSCLSVPGSNARMQAKAPTLPADQVLIESAAGLQAVDDIARSSPRLQALTFGPGDLSASLGLGQLTIGTLDTSGYSGDVWHFALMRILVAARVNGLLAIDGPYAAFG